MQKSFLKEYFQLQNYCKLLKIILMVLLWPYNKISLSTKLDLKPMIWFIEKFYGGYLKNIPPPHSLPISTVLFYNPCNPLYWFPLTKPYVPNLKLNFSPIWKMWLSKKFEAQIESVCVCVCVYSTDKVNGQHTNKKKYKLHQKSLNIFSLNLNRLFFF